MEKSGFIFQLNFVWYIQSILSVLGNVLDIIHSSHSLELCLKIHQSFFSLSIFFLVCKKIAEQIELKMKSYKTNLGYLINGRVRIKSIKFVSSVDAAGIYRGIKMFIKLDQFKALHLIVERHGTNFKKNTICQWPWSCVYVGAHSQFTHISIFSYDEKSTNNFN